MDFLESTRTKKKSLFVFSSDSTQKMILEYCASVAATRRGRRDSTWLRLWGVATNTDAMTESKFNGRLFFFDAVKMQNSLSFLFCLETFFLFSKIEILVTNSILRKIIKIFLLPKNFWSQKNCFCDFKRKIDWPWRNQWRHRRSFEAWGHLKMILC